MKVVHLPRRAGKTTKAIKHAAETNSYIVTSDRNRARDIAAQAKKMGLNIKFPITYSELMDRNRRLGFRPNASIVIDNVDMLLRQYVCTNLKLEMITLDNNEEQTFEEN